MIRWRPPDELIKDLLEHIKEHEWILKDKTCSRGCCVKGIICVCRICNKEQNDGHDENCPVAKLILEAENYQFTPELLSTHEILNK